MSTPDISIIGAAILDVLAYPVTDTVFKTGSIPVEGTKISFGGDALNESTVLTRLGKKVDLISKVGDDTGGDMVLQYCKANGVDTAHIKVEKGLTTGVNIVLADAVGERYFLTNPHSSLRKLSEDDVNEHLDTVGNIVSFASIFVSECLRVPEMTRIFQKIRARENTLLCADMTKAKHGEKLDDIRPILPYIDFLFPNESEIALITGETDVEKNAMTLIDAGVGCVVIKQGKDGCYIRTKEERLHILPYPVEKCVDTTGAGDTFAAGFLWALSERYSLADCGRFACAAASCVVESLGATDAIRSLEQVMERFRKMPEAVRL